jgi:hypothetical protein
MSSTLALATTEKAIEAGKAKAAHLGAIGVGGGYPDQDNEVAEAVKAAL